MNDVICSHCGRVNTASARFCVDCGNALAQNAGPVFVAPSSAQGGGMSGVSAWSQAADQHLKPGMVIYNRYRIESLFGKGGFGAVYKATDLNLQRTCAVKENLESGTNSQRQFEREARVLANLIHPNLPRVTDHFVLPGQGQYLVMDFIEGENLEEIVERKGAVAYPEAIAWITQIVDALTYLHANQPPVIHRDIKPANIRITPQGRAVLVDFGLVKMADPTKPTTTGAQAVTHGYSPPEQYGTGHTDPRSDIYALGATLYNILTGDVPPPSVQRIGNEQLPRLSHGSQTIPPTIAHAIGRAMALDPNQRYQSAKELKTGLYTPITPPPVFSPPPPPTQVIPPRKPLWILWVGLILLLAVALGLGIGYIVNRGIASPTTEPPANTDAPQGGEIPTTDFTATAPQFDTETPEQPQVTIPPTIPPTEIPYPDIHNPASADCSSNRYTLYTPIRRLHAGICIKPVGQVKIHLMDPDNPGSYRMLENPSGYDWSRLPSFCGSKVAVEAWDSSSAQIQWIYLLDPYGGGAQRFNDPSFNALGVPRCSPDSRLIAYSGKSGSNWSLVVREYDGGSPVQVSSARIAGWASWLPSNDRFYFMSATGENPFVISEAYLSAGNWYQGAQIVEGKYPAVSPNGRYLAYYCNNSLDICIAEMSPWRVIAQLDGDTKKVNGQAVPISLMWSGDSQWLYYSALGGPDLDIFRVRPDGSSPMNMTEAWDSDEFNPALQW